MVVTTEAGQDKMSSLLPLLPGPTPTRFLGKMQLLKEAGARRKSEERASSPSRDSSISLSTVDSAQGTDDDLMKEKSTSSQRRASSTKLLSRMKMNIIGNLNASRKDSNVSSEASSKQSTPTNSVTDKKEMPRKGSSVTEKPVKKKGLSAFKAKTGLLGGKKKKSDPTADNSKGKLKEIKSRLFFRTKIEYSDEEIFRDFGTESLQKIFSQGIEQIANAATIMNKFFRNRTRQGTTDSEYVGSMKGSSLILKNSALSTTIFLGKIISKKDKYGLYRGQGSSDADSLQEKDNPLLTALQKIKSKPFEGSDSQPASPAANRRSSHGKNSEQNAAFEDSLQSLQSGLLKVKVVNIKDWNLHKHISSDRELKAISIPF